MNYLTSRLIVMSCPTEGIESAAYGNHIDLVKEAIESKHGKAYRIYNLANRVYKKDRLSQVIDLGATLNSARAPPVALMLKLSANIVKFLAESPKNVCIVHCNDGHNISAMALCTLLMYCGAVRTAEASLNLFCVKRGALSSLAACQLRSLRDTQRLLGAVRQGLPVPFTANECILSSVTLVGVPLFNRARTGCTPYIEVFAKDRKIFTSLQDYDNLKKYTTRDGQVVTPVNCTKFYGEITVIVYHAKSLLGTEKITTNKICQFQFHTGFVAPELNQSGQIRFKKLDFFLQFLIKKKYKSKSFLLS
jgi:cyclin G-associated kinase